MSADVMTWTREEFICYMMIVAAAADGVIEPAEIEHIKEVAGEDTFEKMMGVFKYAMTVPLLAYKQAHSLGSDELDAALHDAMSVYMADGDFDDTEMAQLNDLKKALS